jgi:PAS domain S-box-containing protein
METPVQVQLRLLFDCSLDAIFAADRLGRYLYANRPALDLVGYALEELTERSIADLREESARQGIVERLQSLSRRTAAMEVLLVVKGGARVPVHLSIWPIAIEGEQIFVASARDLRELHRLTREHEDSSQRFRLMFEQSNDALFWEDAGGTILDANNRACALTGIPRETLVGSRAADLPFSIWATKDPEDRVRELREKRNLAFELTVHTVGPPSLLAEVRISLLDTPFGERRLVSVRDVTDQRAAERQVQELQKREAVATLATGVSHEFNNLLAAITCHAELALSVRGRSDDLAAILDAARRGEKLTRTLLSYVRPIPSRFRPLDVNQAASDLAALLRRTLDSAIEIRVERSPQPLFAQVDPVVLDQVLLNLALNSRDAMRDGGRLTISVGREGCKVSAQEAAGDLARITVHDTGAGMEPAVLSKAFDALFTTQPGKRSGLGLTVARNLVEEHHGFLRAASTPGEGSAFSVFLPLAAEPSAGASGEATEPPRGKETVLLVEEDDALRRAAGRALEQLGYVVITARDGRDARRTAGGEEKLALVVLDLDAPMAAEALVGRTARTLRTLGAPAHDQPPGALVKPYNVDELARAVRATLDAPRADGPAEARAKS